MKRLSIFDLQEGKVYNAFDGGRMLSKIYRVSGGKLLNANKGGNPNDLNVYEGCDWVPLKAGINFKEIKGATTGPVTILALKEGTIYSPSKGIAGLVARKGTGLFTVDAKGKGQGTVHLGNVGLDVVFTPVGKISAHTKAWETRRGTSSAR